MLFSSSMLKKELTKKGIKCIAQSHLLRLANSGPKVGCLVFDVYVQPSKQYSIPSAFPASLHEAFL